MKKISEGVLEKLKQAFNRIPIGAEAGIFVSAALPVLELDRPRAAVDGAHRKAARLCGRNEGIFVHGGGDIPIGPFAEGIAEQKIAHAPAHEIEGGGAAFRQAF